MFAVSMTRSIHGYVVSELRATNIKIVAAETKVPASTLRKIRDGHIPNPGVKGMERLYFYFKDREGATLRKRRAA